jgi:hypothetical protein
MVEIGQKGLLEKLGSKRMLVFRFRYMIMKIERIMKIGEKLFSLVSLLAFRERKSRPGNA